MKSNKIAGDVCSAKVQEYLCNHWILHKSEFTCAELALAYQRRPLVDSPCQQSRAAYLVVEYNMWKVVKAFGEGPHKLSHHVWSHQTTSEFILFDPAPQPQCSQWKSTLMRPNHSDYGRFAWLVVASVELVIFQVICKAGQCWPTLKTMLCTCV